MPSQALSDPRHERPTNDALPESGYGRCPTCHVPLEPKRNEWGMILGRPATYCGGRCRIFAWRRDGDPDGTLNRSKSSKWA